MQRKRRREALGGPHRSRRNSPEGQQRYRDEEECGKSNVNSKSQQQGVDTLEIFQETREKQPSSKIGCRRDNALPRHRKQTYSCGLILVKKAMKEKKNTSISRISATSLTEKEKEN